MDIWTTNKGVEWTRPDATPASIFFVAFLLNCGVRGTGVPPLRRMVSHFHRTFVLGTDQSVTTGWFNINSTNRVTENLTSHILLSIYLYLVSANFKSTWAYPWQSYGLVQPIRDIRKPNFTFTIFVRHNLVWSGRRNQYRQEMNNK